jgi:hypothetical protein
MATGTFDARGGHVGRSRRVLMGRQDSRGAQPFSRDGTREDPPLWAAAEIAVGPSWCVENANRALSQTNQGIAASQASVTISNG